MLNHLNPHFIYLTVPWWLRWQRIHLQSLSVTLSAVYKCACSRLMFSAGNPI